MHRSQSLISLFWLLSNLSDLSQARPSSDIKPRQKPLQFKSYTAIGDSYASGVGAGDAAPQNAGYEGCLRNVGSYAYQFAQKHKPGEFHFNACSGYQIQNTIDVQINGPNSDFGNPDLVTVSVGGNEESRFLNIAEQCIYNPLIGITGLAICQPAVQAARNTYSGMQSKLESVITAALTHNLGPNDKRIVAMIGYPIFYNVDNGIFKAPQCFFNVRPRRKTINDVSGILNGAISAAVDAVNKNPAVPKGSGSKAVFVPVNDNFDGHRFCENPDSPWLIGGPDAAGNHNENPPWIAYLHPTVDGHNAFLSKLEEVLQGVV